MKPAWDSLASEYEGSSSVVIGDVDCTVESDLCSQKGVSGYPTIKYFTAEAPDGTDYRGGRELEDLKKFTKDTLEKLCDLSDEASCSEKELDYAKKMREKGGIPAMLQRLEGMKGNKMKADLKGWLFTRIHILKQLTAEAGKEEL